MHNEYKKNITWDMLPSTEAESQLIDHKIVEFNRSQVPFTQTQTPILKNYIVKDNGTIVAGINALIYHWNVLYIDVLFVDEQYRGQHLGSSLLQQVEREAKSMGSKLAHLDTFDFQAKDFYLKRGYEIFGVLENCPAGHKRYFLRKSL